MDEQYDPRLQRVLDELRRSLTEAPEEHIAQRHLSAMRGAAGDTAGDLGWWGRVRERRETRRKPVPAFSLRWLAAGVATLFGLTGGLAAADVLPDPAQEVVADAVGAIGLDLPRPDDKPTTAADSQVSDDDDADVDAESADPEANDHGQTVVSVAQDSELEACEKGQAVRDTASSKNQADPDAVGQSDDHDPCEDEGTEVGEDSVGDDDPEVGPADGDNKGLDEADDHRQDAERRPDEPGVPDE